MGDVEFPTCLHGFIILPIFLPLFRNSSFQEEHFVNLASFTQLFTQVSHQLNWIEDESTQSFGHINIGVSDEVLNFLCTSCELLLEFNVEDFLNGTTNLQLFLNVADKIDQIGNFFLRIFLKGLLLVPILGGLWHKKRVGLVIVENQHQLEISGVQKEQLIELLNLLISLRLGEKKCTHLIILNEEGRSIASCLNLCSVLFCQSQFFLSIYRYFSSVEKGGDLTYFLSSQKFQWIDNFFLSQWKTLLTADLNYKINQVFVNADLRVSPLNYIAIIGCEDINLIAEIIRTVNNLGENLKIICIHTDTDVLQNIRQELFKFSFPDILFRDLEHGILEGTHGKDQNGIFPIFFHIEEYKKYFSPFKQGGIMVNFHSVDTETAFKNIGMSPHFSLQLILNLKGQYPSPADEYLLACSKVGLFPKLNSFSKFPHTAGFAAVTCCHFEKREYSVRKARLDDINKLLVVEKECWALPLRVDKGELLRRISTFPRGQLVLQYKGDIIGVMYSQQITNISEEFSYLEIGRLFNPSGTTIQFLAVNVLPEFQQGEFGNQLLEFMLIYSSTFPNIHTAVAVTRCKNFLSQNKYPLSEYIFQTRQDGLPLDPVLRFHGIHGATIEGLLPRYRPGDIDNEGAGIVVNYQLLNRKNLLESNKASAEETVNRKLISSPDQVETFLRESLVSVLGRESFLETSTFMELGIDSLGLLEFRERLQNKLGVDISPTIFFEHFSFRKLLHYFLQRNSLPPKLAPPKGMKIISPSALSTNRQQKETFLLCISAGTRFQLEKRVSSAQQEILQNNNSTHLENFCYLPELDKSSQFSHRMAVVGSSSEELFTYLNNWNSGLTSPKNCFSTPFSGCEQDKLKIGFLFSNSGTHVGLGITLYRLSNIFRISLQKCETILLSLIPNFCLTEILYSPATGQLMEKYALPIIFSVEYSLCKFWNTLGITPNVVIGYGFSEYVAACIAGAITLEEGLKISIKYADILLQQTAAFVSIFTNEHTIRMSLLNLQQPHSIKIVGINSPNHTVVSGPKQELDMLLKKLGHSGNIRHIFSSSTSVVHSPLVVNLLLPFKNMLKTCNFSSPNLSLISSLTGTRFPFGKKMGERYWRKQLSSPVRFLSGVYSLLEDSTSIFIEIGPSGGLLSIAQDVCKDLVYFPKLLFLSSLRHGSSTEWRGLLSNLAKLYTLGANINVELLVNY